MTAAAPAEVSKLGQKILEFKQRYEILASIPYGARIARSGDSALMQDYGNTLARAEQIKGAIEATENAWTNAKSWSGLGSLGIVPVIAAIVVAGLLTTVVGGIYMVDTFMRRAGVKQIQADNPNLPYAQAVARYEQVHSSTFEKGISALNWAVLVAGALGVMYFLRK